MGAVNLKKESKRAIINLKTQECFELQDGMTLGRNKSCSIAINDNDVSRNHLAIRIDSCGGIWLKDESTNGTFVNNKKITKEMQITTDSTLKIGKTEFKIVLECDQPVAAIQSKSKNNLKLIKNFKEDYSSYPPAPTYKRFVAFAFDGVIITVLTQISDVLLKLTKGNHLFYQVLFGAVIIIFYHHHFLNKQGQSIGKTVMKLRVVSTDHREHFSFFRVLVREYFIKTLLIAFSVISIFLSDKKLALHDRIAKTRVIDISTIK
jgi:uncharacterized RDD family membrane protein YckC